LWRMFAFANGHPGTFHLPLHFIIILYNSDMEISYQSEYDANQDKEKYIRRAEFILARILKVVFAFLLMLLKLTWDILKGVLKTFGVPIG